MGDHLRDHGMDCWLVGKTHMKADTEGMERLGIPPDSIIGVRTEQCGFDVWERDDGMRPEGPDGLYDEKGAESYNAWLRERGYPGDNPWHDFANASRDEVGNVLSGWVMENARKPAAIEDEESETPYMTSRAIEFMDQAGVAPWCLHLSYIKPHWPYIAPPPYNDMYGPEHLIPVNRADAEWDDMHPVFEAYASGKIGKCFARDEVRAEVIPSYMGLIKQCDDQMGRLFAYLKETGRWDDTLIVLTSDHGDYLGDHWMGEKDMFHDCSARIPMIIRDPSPAADAARGTTCDALVEAIDMAPTFLEIAGSDARPHILEGRSLMPLVHGKMPDDWRSFAISENNYGLFPGVAAFADTMADPRQFMVVTKRWKYVHAPGLRPMLFDLDTDPNELNDLGNDPAYAGICASHREMLADWAQRLSQRVTMSKDQVAAERKRSFMRGIQLGVFAQDELPEPARPFYGLRPGPETNEKTDGR